MADVQRVLAEDVQVGDDLLYLGKPYRILEILPYGGSLDTDGTWRLACSHGEWVVTLIPGQSWWVTRG